jgi:hypothetical protein
LRTASTPAPTRSPEPSGALARIDLGWRRRAGKVVRRSSTLMRLCHQDRPDRD